MFELLVAGGPLMIPLVLCSIAVLAIAIERFLTLRADKVLPANLLGRVGYWLNHREMTAEKLRELHNSSPLGAILAAGLSNADHGREVMKDCIEEAANQVIHRLERYLTALGTIASLSPLIGLLGTVFGMIQVFTAITATRGTATPDLAGGIAQALITTAAGLIIAIPAHALHRYFERRVDSFVVEMENQAIKLVDAFHGDRRMPAEIDRL